MPHLVSAFQQFAEIQSIGPLPSESYPDAWPGVWPPHNHIDIHLNEIESLFDVLPNGWVPDLVVAISGGGIPMFTNTHDLPCPTVFYSVDTWQCYMDYREALHYDVVFAGQRAYVPLLRATGSRHVYWLPMACNPGMHRPIDLPKAHDIVFVGGTTEPVHWQRLPLIDALRSRCDVYSTGRVYGEAMNRAYATGRIAFNHSAVQDVNMRIFESLAMGCALLTNRDSVPNGLLELFDDAKHLFIYDDADDLARKASQLLSDESLRNTLAIEGRKKVLKHHTYRHRAQTILDTLRSLAPGFPTQQTGPRKLGDSILDYLPRVPGAVLDYGMSMNVTKYAAAKRGATQFAGYSDDANLRRQRAGSFDSILYTVDDAHEPFDTVVINEAYATDDAIRTAWRLLDVGGTLILRRNTARLTEGTPKDVWLRSRDFHLVYEAPSATGTTVLVARKRVRRLADVAREVCQTLRVPGVDGDVIAGMMDPDW